MFGNVDGCFESFYGLKRHMDNYMSDFTDKDIGKIIETNYEKLRVSQDYSCGASLSYIMCKNDGTFMFATTGFDVICAFIGANIPQPTFIDSVSYEGYVVTLAKVK